ncbi:MAG: hypothetical protein ACI8U0_002843 [Flavobacteriales bacterium]|jgi:hypothetical protein
MKKDGHEEILQQIEWSGRFGLISALIIASSSHFKNSEIIFYKSLLFFGLGTLALIYVAVVRIKLKNKDGTKKK